MFGNSGSGKSRFSKRIGAAHAVPVLDLDRVVWTKTVIYRTDREITDELARFTEANNSWIVEGCYGRWMEHLSPHATEIVFLNPGESVCLSRCIERPWESHKYASKEEQDANLSILLEWVREYYTRSDDMSYLAHRRLYDSFQGIKREFGLVELQVGT